MGKSRQCVASSRPFAVLIATMLMTAGSMPTAAQQLIERDAVPQAKISTLGHYAGYSPATYDGWIRESHYITTRDGTRLAADIFRPTRGGAVTAEKLPVVWTHHRYQRAGVDNGTLYTILDTFDWLTSVLRHGYVVAAVDVRGSGASYGRYEGMYAAQETNDAYDVTEWLAAQPWSSGAIGMYGVSYLASTQYMTASLKPPHLKAIVPDKGVADQYELLWSGGIFRGPFVENWTNIVYGLDSLPTSQLVDGDAGRQLLAAVDEHRANRNTALMVAGLPYRDSTDPISGTQPWLTTNAITRLHAIEESGVAIYHLAGWYDRYVRDQLVLFHNLDNAQKITIGPWSHALRQGLDRGAEHLRWWDHWLKGIDNGVTREARVNYYLIGAPESSAWRTSDTWPPAGVRRVRYFAGKPSHDASADAASGELSAHAPQRISGSDELHVNRDSIVWPAPRWSMEAEYGDLATYDAQGLSYTTEPLSQDLEIVGHPQVQVWISSQNADADVFAVLEQVDAQGHSHYITEGALRASNRAQSTPPFDFMDLPYHRAWREDRQPLRAGVPVELAFDLFPTATLVKAGQRLRLTFNGADAANARTPTSSSQWTLHWDRAHPTFVELPLMGD